LFEGVEKVLYQIPYLQSTIAWIDSLARGSILPVIQTSFFSSILISSIFFIIIALNAFAPRFWCRYLCPLGGFLGWISHLAIFRPHQGNSCNQCTRCALICRPGAIETSNEIINIQPSECTVCLDCLAGCPRRDIDFKTMQRPAPAQTFDLSRRQFLLGMATAVGGLLYLRIDLRLQQRPPRFIRPPGVDNNESFLRKCLRCSECIKICPMTALHPAGSESGLEGLWSPQVVPRVGYCDYSCNACGQICPSGAIPPLLLEEKRLAVIGKASVNRNRCLPWSSNTSCIICEEMCPTPQKSIRLEEVAVQMEDGKEIILQRPYVLREICIGCGICENRCPLEGEAAIQVYSIIV
jgi:ferredoxin